MTPEIFFRPNAEILIGPPGCGKGTLAKCLARHKGVAFLEMGELLRDIAKSPTNPLATEIKNLQLKGEFVNDDLVSRVAQNFLQKAEDDPDQNYHTVVFDGFPRSMSQTSIALKLLRKFKYDEITYVVIDTPEQTCIERMMRSERGRSDDGSHAIAQRRYRTYMEKTHPMVKSLCRGASSEGISMVRLVGTDMKMDAPRLAEALLGLRNRI